MTNTRLNGLIREPFGFFVFYLMGLDFQNTFTMQTTKQNKKTNRQNQEGIKKFYACLEDELSNDLPLQGRKVTYCALDNNNMDPPVKYDLDAPIFFFFKQEELSNL